jgi:nitrite reductase/ring-hydroxylating ferredoxin subunit
MIDRTLTTVDVSSLTEERDTVHFAYQGPFGEDATGFVILWKGELRAYRNLCPHWSIPLDQDGEVFGPRKRQLFCPHHGARFDPATGRCTIGPPRGSGIEAFDVAHDPEAGTATISRRMGRLRF